MATNPLDPVKQPAEEGMLASAADAAPVTGGGKIDIDPIIQKINIPPQFKPIYDKAVLAGLRIMFDRQSHKMLLEQLDKEGPLAGKISEGVVALMYMLWEQSNKTLPPQIIVPVTFTLTLRAFEFCQMSGEPEATKETLGEAVAQSTKTIMSKFGVEEDQIEQLVAQQQQRVGDGGEQPQPDVAPAKAAPGASTSPRAAEQLRGMLQGDQ